MPPDPQPTEDPTAAKPQVVVAGNAEDQALLDLELAGTVDHYSVKPRQEPQIIVRQAAKDETEMLLYGEIGGWFGITAAQFRAQLAKVKTKNLKLRINSGGGSAFEGVAIYNSLKQHPAVVTATVDGLAASAASFIAMAAEKVVVNEAAMMMIHKSWAGTMGNEDDMLKTAELLGKVDDSVAGIYTRKAGGEKEEWLAAMRAESWYTADEAVEAGLADATTEDAPPADAEPADSFDLGIYAYAGRANAPKPAMPGRPRTPARAKVSAADAARQIHAASKTPAGSQAGGPTQKESNVDPVKIREALGLAADASDDEVAAEFAKATTPPSSEGGSGGNGATPPPARLPKSTDQAEAILLDPAQLARLREDAELGRIAYAKMKANERDQVLDAAMALGKFPPSRREHYARMWDADEEGTREVIEKLAANVIPTEGMGYMGAQAQTEADLAYDALYGAPKRR